jgi:hypothetical protein
MSNELYSSDLNFDTIEAAVDRAWAAYHREDWELSFEIWNKIRNTWEDYPPPYVHAATSLVGMGMSVQAVSLLHEGHLRFPENSEILLNLAKRILDSGDYANASNILENNLSKFSDQHQVLLDFLKMAIDRDDYSEAHRRSRLVTDIIQNCKVSHDELKKLLSYIDFKLRINDIDSGSDPLSSSLNNNMIKFDDTSISPDSLMLAFEGLGENCEFGLVQRYFGAEPLGLLRWTATSADNLIRALRDRFENVGQPQQTRVVEIENEYMTVDTVYGMGSHTFIKIDRTDKTKIERNLTKRLQYLRSKIISDLEDGEKICVYHSESVLSLQKIRDLHSALLQYGTRYLMCVTKADSDHAAGSLIEIYNGLMVGYIDKLGPDRTPTGDRWSISNDIWLTLCQQAYEIRRASEPKI